MILKNKTLWHLLWMGFNCLKGTATLMRQFTFYHSVPRNSWYSFCWPPKDERLSRPWNHTAVLNMGPLDWESSALTTRPMLHGQNKYFILQWQNIGNRNNALVTISKSMVENNIWKLWPAKMFKCIGKELVLIGNQYFTNRYQYIITIVAYVIIFWLIL